MCRTGGRRCPSHTDPAKVAAYNARRRELYAANKKKPNETDSLYSFPPLTDFKTAYSEVAAEYEAAGIAFAEKLTTSDSEEDYDIDWKTLFDKELPPKAAVFYYTAQGYAPIRDFLNNRRVRKMGLPDEELKMSDKQKAWFAKTTAAMDIALAAVEKPEKPRVLYRGLKVNHQLTGEQARRQVAENFPVGGVVSQKSYMSTTLDASLAAEGFGSGMNANYDHDADHSVVMEILSREGAPLNVGTSTFGTEEREVLLPRDLRLKVVSVDYDVDYSYSYTADGVTDDMHSKKTVIRLIDVGEEE